MRARGIVEHAVLLGAPVRADAPAEWAAARAVVAGRLVNGFSSHDWVHGRACIPPRSCSLPHHSSLYPNPCERALGAPADAIRCFWQ